MYTKKIDKQNAQAPEGVTLSLFFINLLPSTQQCLLFLLILGRKAFNAFVLIARQKLERASFLLY
jgi:hypothetical protein